MFRRLSKTAVQRAASASAAREIGFLRPTTKNYLYRRSPFADFDWLFTDPFFSAVPAAFQVEAAPVFDSRLTAHEVANGVQVELEVPRYRPEDIVVKADAKTGIVTISGKLPPATTNQTSHTTATVPAFDRSFTASPSLFDLEKMTSSVEHGLLKITIPRKPQETKQVEAPKTEKVLPIETVPAPAETKEIAAPVIPRSWPPKIDVKEKPADGVAVSFSLALPSAVKPENVKLKFVEPHGLRVEASYSVRKKSGFGYEQHAASFSRYLNLPEHTSPADVKTKFDNGQLNIEVAQPKAK